MRLPSSVASQTQSLSALRLGQYISRSASKVVESNTAIVASSVWASIRAQGWYSSGCMTRSVGKMARSRGCSGSCFRVE